MIQPWDTGSARIVGFKLSGKLHHEDYETFAPALVTAIAARGKVHLLAQFEDFHGCDSRAGRDDFCFGVKYHSDFDRTATEGDQAWEEWMTRLSKPFVRAGAKYFPSSQLGAARICIEEGIEPSGVR